MRWLLVSVHPLSKFKDAKVDQQRAVRFLSADKEKALRDALVARDAKRIAGRQSANAWRHARGYEQLPAFGRYSDHVTPLVILALNTGLRRGELLGLNWPAIDFDRRILTVYGAGAKSGETRHLPLNSEAIRVLTDWKGDSTDRAGLVFAGFAGDAIADLKTAWLGVAKAANLGGFRFNDLRHSFASRLVVAGVDLDTVRELLGHSDLAMTLRYAHLAPEHKAAAVERLVASA
jgi:integrase